VATNRFAVVRFAWHCLQRRIAAARRVVSCGDGGAKPTSGTWIPRALWHSAHAAPNGVWGITGGAPL